MLCARYTNVSLVPVVFAVTVLRLSGCVPLGWKADSDEERLCRGGRVTDDVDARWKEELVDGRIK